jgi:rhomboid protease GluP
MAFGFPPKYQREFTFENLTPEAMLITALEAAKKLGWDIGHTAVSGFIAYTKTSFSSWSEEFRFQISEGKAIILSLCTGSQLMDWGKNKKNVEAFLVAFKECHGSLTPEEIISRYETIKSQSLSGDGQTNQPIETAHGKLDGFLSIFVPVEGFYITPMLLIVNIFIFFMMVVSGVDFMLPTTDSLITWGANFRPVTLEGEWWRLIASCFIHIGVIHLLMNMYALLYIGLLLEPQLGKVRFAIAYLVTGIGGSAMSLYWHELTVSAGASGAIFGMYGVFLAMLTTNLIEKSARKTLLTSIGIFVGYNLLNGLKGGIDNAAHIGGLLSGLIIGYAFYLGLKKQDDENLKWLTTIAPSVIIILAAAFAYFNTPNDIGMYDKKMKVFASLESNALKVYEKAANTGGKDLLKELNDHGITNWKKSIQVIKEADKLNLPYEVHERNKKLIEYCELRIKSYQLIYKALEEDTDNYQSEILIYNKQIESLISEIAGKQ